jgi:ubiquinone/menaquinone biosynthesis C-methylase UbiE
MSRNPRDSHDRSCRSQERASRDLGSRRLPAVAEVIDAIPPRDVLDRVGVDLTPELFDTARRRAEWHDVVVDWVEGDAEHLPFEDASFDRVFSAFGMQFAPRHAIVARELARVCRPGGPSGHGSGPAKQRHRVS